MEKKLEVPFRQLSRKALEKVIEDYILRQSSEFARSDLSLAQKVLRVQYDLDTGKAKIVFDPSAKTHSVIKCDA